MTAPLMSHRRKPKRSRRSWLLYCMTLMLLVTVAFCMWGLVESILVSGDKISGFWGVVDDAQAQVEELLATSNKTLDSLQARSPVGEGGS